MSSVQVASWLGYRLHEGDVTLDATVGSLPQYVPCQTHMCAVCHHLHMTQFITWSVNNPAAVTAVHIRARTVHIHVYIE